MFDGFALGWDCLTRAQSQKGPELTDRPRSCQNGLLLPAKEHRQHTHLPPGDATLGLTWSDRSIRILRAGEQDFCHRASAVGGVGILPGRF